MVQPHHLQSHEHQYRRQTVLEQMKLFDRAPQHEIERSQAKNGENIRGEDNERLPRQCEYRGHGVDRKNNIGRLERQQSHEQRRCPKPSLFLEKEPVAVEIVRYGEKTPDGTNHGVPFRIGRFSGTDGHFDTGEDQKHSEDNHNPMELNEGRTERDENSAEHERTKDAVKENAVLVAQRYGKVSQYENEDKD